MYRPLTLFCGLLLSLAGVAFAAQTGKAGILHPPAPSPVVTTAQASSSYQQWRNARPKVAASTSSFDSDIFQIAAEYSSGGIAAAWVAVGDFNGDGKLDLAVVNQCDYLGQIGQPSGECNNFASQVGVFLGNGDGTFQTPLIYPGGLTTKNPYGTTYFTIAVADVNGDGKPDLLVSQGIAAGVMLGNGDGTFQNVVSYDFQAPGYVSGIVRYVSAADLNGDGKLDLIVSTSVGTDVLLGKGDGTFGTPVTVSQIGGISFAGDVNGDGNQDLVVIPACCSADVLLGNGDGTFQAPIVTSQIGISAQQFVAIGDVNGDGRSDLVVTASPDTFGESGEVAVLLGNGDGTFQSSINHFTGGSINFHSPANTVVLADVNGDHKPDLVLGLGAGIGVMLGNGDGTFQDVVSYDPGGSGGGFGNPVAPVAAVGDVNGDGKLDLIAMNRCAFNYLCDSGGGVGVIPGNGDGTFQAPATYLTGATNPVGVSVADVNLDGQPDLVVVNECILHEPPASSNCNNGFHGAVSVFLGKPDGSFQSKPLNFDAGVYASDSMAVGDFNGDGKPDVILTNYCISQGCYLTVLLGNGDGTFKTPVAYPLVADSLGTVLAADLNGDGKLDVVVNVNGGLGASVLLGNGDGTFQPPQPILFGVAGGGSVEQVADVNGDGKLDLLVANACLFAGCGTAGSSSNSAVGVLLGNGDGTFQPEAVAYDSGGYRPVSIAVGDLNRDGKPDLVVENAQPSVSDYSVTKVGILLGNGDGTFQATTSITTPPTSARTGRIVIADFNGDGFLDAVSGDAAFILVGNGDGTFQAPQILNIPRTGLGTAVGDFNHDGKPDLVVNATTVLLNISKQSYIGTSTTVSSSPNPSVYGHYVAFIAHVTANGPGTPTGSVYFSYGSTPVGTSSLISGVARLTTLVLAGNLPITATYSGDSNFSGSSGVETQVENRAPTSCTLQFGPNPAALATSVNFYAFCGATIGIYNVTTSDGTVSFYDGTSLLGTASYSLADFGWYFTNVFHTPGTHPLTAVYNGDANFAPGTSPVLSEKILNATTTTIGSNSNPSSVNQSIIFSSMVTGQSGVTPSGTVSFTINGNTPIIEPLVNGLATFPWTFLYAGARTVTASYSGDTNNAASTSAALPQQINAPPGTTTSLMSSLNPSRVEQALNITAKVTAQGGGTATGTVTFTINGNTPISEPLVNGLATFPWTFLNAGLRTITASYSGDVGDSPSSSSPLTQTVGMQASQTSLTSSANPSGVNQTVNFVATVTGQNGGTPTGSVTFNISANKPVSVPLSGGKATYPWTFGKSGPRTVTASYSGDANDSASTSATLAQQINPVPATQTALVASVNPSAVNQPVTYSATVTGQSGVPTGSVTFTINGNKPVAVSLTNGQAIFNWTYLNAGSRTIIANYSGDGNNQASFSSTLTQTITP